MPELPEVETVRVGLNNLIKLKTISLVSYDWPKSFPNDQDLVSSYLIGSQIKSIRRRAKLLIINFSSGYSLIIHLKMTGQLVYKEANYRFGAGHPSDSLVGHLPDKSTRVILTFSDKSQLFFNDQRKFGWMRLIKTTDLKPILEAYGPEPLSPSFNAWLFKEQLLKRPNTAIKAALLDQSIVAGIGNIYADESLFDAKIHPLARVSTLSNQKIKQLLKSLTMVLELAIKNGGSTDRNYVNAKGQKGSYIKIAKVFRKEGQPCPRCSHLIVKIKAAGRGTHYCPYCQRL